MESHNQHEHFHQGRNEIAINIIAVTVTVVSIGSVSKRLSVKRLMHPVILLHSNLAIGKIIT